MNLTIDEFIQECYNEENLLEILSCLDHMPPSHVGVFRGDEIANDMWLDLLDTLPDIGDQFFELTDELHRCKQEVEKFDKDRLYFKYLMLRYEPLEEDYSHHIRLIARQLADEQWINN